MAKKKILHIMTRYLGGGSETYVNHLIDRLNTKKYEHILAHGKIYDEEMIKKVLDKNVKTKCFKNLSHYNPVTGLLAIRDINKYLINNKIDIVHTHQTEAGIIGRIAANMYNNNRRCNNKKIKIIHTVHGIPFTNNRNYILRKGLIYLERLVARYTDDIITISNDMKKSYLDNNIGTYKQFKCIPLGINLDLFKKAKPFEYIKNEKDIPIKFIMVSRLTKGKGLEDLIEAVNCLVNLWNIKFKLYLVGEWDNVKYKQDILTLINKKNGNLQEYIKFMGYRTDIPEILKACDVFILPSYYEGTPWTIYEAMAAELPIISTNISGIPEQVEHDYNGYLVKPGDLGNLIMYMLTFYNVKDLAKKMGMNSKEKIKDFNIDKMVKSIEVLYDEE